MFDTIITVVGNVVDEPQLRSTATGKTLTRFRIASTARRREGDAFVDIHTLYLNVTCWQDMAHNVATSIRKGQPVVVTGRVYTHEYTKDEQRQSSLEMRADAVGHNLARGSSEFTKTTRAFAASSTPLDEDGLAHLASDELDGVVTQLSDDSLQAPF